MVIKGPLRRADRLGGQRRIPRGQVRTTPEVAKTADVAIDEIIVHDAQVDPAYAFALSRLSDQNLDHTVLGIFRSTSAGQP